MACRLSCGINLPFFLPNPGKEKHQKRRIRNFEDVSKCLLRNAKLSSPYIYPQLSDQIDNENNKLMKILLKLAQWYSWSQTCDILSFSLAVLKSNLKEPNLKKGTSDIMSLISRSSLASIPFLPEEVRVMILSPSVPANKRTIFISLPYKKKPYKSYLL